MGAFRRRSRPGRGRSRRRPQADLLTRRPTTRLGAALADRSLVRAPSLQTDKPRTASRLELFFDLAFVLVIAQLAGTLRSSPTVHSTLVAAGLFSVLWWSWMSSALYANRFDHDDVIYRLTKLTGMLFVLGMAASVTQAAGRYAMAFIVCYVAIRLLLLASYARVYRHVPEARDGVRIYVLGIAVGAALWSVSAAVPGPARYVLWGAGLLVDAVAPLLVTASRTEVPLHLEHLPERFALFVILVLGESVTAVAHGVSTAHWRAGSLVAGAVCFLVVAALWWSWFDLAGAGAKHLLHRAADTTGTLTYDIYVYGHLPLSLSLAAVGAGVQGIVVEGTARAGVGPQNLLAGGVALYLLTVGVTNAGMERRGLSAWWAAALAAVVAVATAAFALPALAVAAILAVLLVAVVVVGIEQGVRGNLELAEL